jgi:FolB domain-containing protein
MNATDETSKNQNRLWIHGMELSSVIGVYQGEKISPQPLILDFGLSFDLSASARTDDIALTVNYARLTAEIRFLMETGRFLLIETAAEALCSWILSPPTPDAPRPQVDSVELLLHKPKALGPRGGVPTVQITRQVSSQTLKQENTTFGRIDVIHEGKTQGIYRMSIAPGKSMGARGQASVEKSDMILGAKLRLQNRPARAGMVYRWPPNVSSRWENASDIEQTLLSVSRPATIPKDENVSDETLLPIEGESSYPAGEHE